MIFFLEYSLDFKIKVCETSQIRNVNVNVNVKICVNYFLMNLS